MIPFSAAASPIVYIAALVGGLTVATAGWGADEPPAAPAAPAPAAAAPAAPAAPASDHTFTGNLAFVSDYRFRGVSQTWKRPAVQGGFDYAHASGFYLGTWGSNVSGNTYNNANLEWDFYGGYNGKVNDDLSYNVGVLEYYYPGGKTPTSPSNKYNTFEAYAGVTYKWVNIKYSHTMTDYFGVDASNTPANFNGGADAPNGNSKGSGYLEANLTYELMPKLNLIGHVGHQAVHHYGNLSYTDYKLGATYEYNAFVFGLAYVGTDAKNPYYKFAANGETKELAKDTLVLSVSKTF
jgi:uncharacterized protein (TIGR02001 family)